MSSEELIPKLRAYLEGLSGDAQALIVRSIEQSRARGDQSQVHELILSAMRGVMRDGGGVFPRMRTAERAFFEPLTPIIIDEKMPDKERGRIERRSLRPIWTWVTRDLAPGRFEDLLYDARNAASDGDLERLNAAGKKVREAFRVIAREVMAETEMRYGGLHRLSGQLGSPRALEDLHDILDIYDHEAAFIEFQRRLPRKVQPGRDGFDAISIALNALEGVPVEAQALAYAYMMPHLGAPGDLARFAVHAGQTDRPNLLRKTKYAPAISMLLGEIAREIEVVTAGLERNRTSDVATVGLRRFHDHVRSLTSALDAETNDNWFRRLSTLRTRMSDRLAHEIEPIPRILRGAFKVTTKDGMEQVTDAQTLEEARVGAHLLVAAKLASESLAINALVAETYKFAEQLLEQLGNKAIDDLHKIAPENKDARMTRADLAVELGGIIMGAEFGKILKRKRDAALGITHDHRSRRAS